LSVRIESHPTLRFMEARIVVAMSSVRRVGWP
jgi:hypothetical protein